MDIQKELNSKLLLYCVTDNEDGILLALIEGADVNCRDNANRTPLHLVTAFNASEMVVKVLIQSGAEVNAVDVDNVTPLHNACFEGRADIVRLLLDNGAKVNIKNIWEQTPLFFAVQAFPPAVEVVRMMLERGEKEGVDINALDANGYTPLMYASSVDERVEVVKELLAWGADASIRGFEGKDALTVAVEHAALSVGQVLYEWKRKMGRTVDKRKVGNLLFR